MRLSQVGRQTGRQTDMQSDRWTVRHADGLFGRQGWIRTGQSPRTDFSVPFWAICYKCGKMDKSKMQHHHAIRFIILLATNRQQGWV